MPDDHRQRAGEQSERHTVAAFRPDDERLERALDVLDGLGVTGVGDPMLAVESTGT